MAVYKNEKGKWDVNFRGHHKRGFNTKKEAQDYEVKIRLNDDSNIENIYIYNVADDYLDWLKKSVAYSTYIKCNQAMKNIILPMIKNKRLNHITDMDCRKFHESLLEKNYSSRYKNYLQNKYVAIFKHAQKYFNYNGNPTRYLDSFKRSHNEKIKRKEKELSVWSDDEFNKFIKFVTNEKYKLLYITLYYSGMRIGEAQALTWKDFKKGRLYINKSLCKCSENMTYEIKDTKTESSMREIDMPIGVIELLEKRHEEEKIIPGYIDDWFIFGRANPLPRTTIDRLKNEAIKKSGVKRITLHDFRHSHASNLISNNINIVAISRRLGHSDINMTLKVYAHLMPKNEEELNNYLNKSYQNLTKQK